MSSGDLLNKNQTENKQTKLLTVKPGESPYNTNILNQKSTWEGASTHWGSTTTQDQNAFARL